MVREDPAAPVGKAVIVGAGPEALVDLAVLAVLEAPVGKAGLEDPVGKAVIAGAGLAVREVPVAPTSKFQRQKSTIR